MKLLKYIPFIVLIGLIVANVFIFMLGVDLAEKINHFETDIRRLKQENMELEKRVYAIDSLDYASKQAKKMSFTKKSTTILLENLKYAFNQ